MSKVIWKMSCFGVMRKQTSLVSNSFRQAQNKIVCHRMVIFNVENEWKFGVRHIFQMIVYGFRGTNVW